jgi:glycosyltransferase involved in cell wall biosynthesis
LETPTALTEADAEPELDVSVILPAYNEELALGADLDDVRCAMERTGYRYEVLVVDDGSGDRTAAIAAERPWVRLLQHPFNRGNGAARTTGVRAARGRWILFTDADRTYPNDRMPELLALMAGGADMVIGARRVEAGTMRWLRTPAKTFIRKLAEFLTGSRIPDLNSGLRAQRRDLTLRFLPILPTSHSWVSTITIAFLSNGYLVKYLPIDYFPRVGRSTFHPLRDSYNYLSLIVRAVMYFNPLKVFLPLGLALLALGTFKYLLYDILYRYGVVYGQLWPLPPMPAFTLALLVTGLQVAVIGLLADLIVRRTQL